MKKSTETLDWMFVAKGIGILFVVIGHFDPSVSPKYWVDARRVFELFHMPLFFVLSGYLHVHGKYAYRDLVGNKIKRLMYPFMSIALFFFVVKYVVGQFVPLRYPVGFDSLHFLLTAPDRSYVPVLWFVYALFVIFAIYPILRLCISNWLILGASASFVFCFGSELPVVGRAMFYMPFFVSGVMLRENERIQRAVLNTKLTVLGVTGCLFTAFAVGNCSYEFVGEWGYLFTLLPGILGTILVINVSKRIVIYGPQKLTAVFYRLGSCSMTIYLFHLLFESPVRIIFMRKLAFLEIPFVLVAVVAVCAGIIFPLEFEKRILRKYLVTRKYILGAGGGKV